MENCSLILIPFWVERALKRNNLSLKDVLSFDSVRPLMSTDDLAGLLALQHSFDDEVLSCISKSILLSSWEQTLKRDMKVELVSTIIPLSYSEEAIKEATNRLVYQNEEVALDVNNQDFFKIIDVERNTFAVVLNEGYTSVKHESVFQMKLVNQLLRLFYVYYKVEDVSKMPIFDLYLNLLDRTTLSK